MSAATQKRKPENAMTPAERTANMLAFRGPTHNFGPRVASKPAHVARGAFKTI